MFSKKPNTPSRSSTSSTSNRSNTSNSSNQINLAAKMKIEKGELKISGELSLKETEQLINYLKNENTLKKASLHYWEIIPAKGESTAAIHDAIVNLPEIFRYNSAMTAFTISGHYIGGSDALIVAFGEVLKHNCILQNLDFYAMTFNRRGMQALADAIRINRTLLHLGFGQMISLEASDLQLILDAVKQNPVIEVTFDAQLLQLAKPASRALLVAIQAQSELNKLNRSEPVNVEPANTASANCASSSSPATGMRFNR